MKIIYHIIFVMAAWPPAPVEARLPLDKLSDCRGLRSLIESIRNDPIDCRSPNTSAEQRLFMKYGRAPSHICFLPKAPAVSLSGFHCGVFDSGPNWRSIECYHQISYTEIADYMRNYERDYASKVVDYLNKAAMCDVGNGDPSAASKSALGQIVSEFAKLDVGFILPTGKGDVGNGIILHGFGRADPGLFDGSEPAVEYVTAFVKW